jgi:hypothetical protein
MTTAVTRLFVPEFSHDQRWPLATSLEDFRMFALGQIRSLKLAAAGVLAAIAFANTSVAADEAAAMRPVGPHEPILASVGERRVVASFASEFGHCAVNASVWASIEAQADSALRLRVSLSPGQSIHIDSLEGPRRSTWRGCRSRRH